jgi:hypothetical protein
MSDRLFEGYQIERQQANVTFDIETEDEYHFKVDQPMVLVIAVTVDVPRFGRTKDGGLKRVNKLIPAVARVATGAERNELVDRFGLELPGEGLFYSPPTELADPRTGELPPPVRGSGHDHALADFLDQEGTG